MESAHHVSNPLEETFEPAARALGLQIDEIEKYIQSQLVEREDVLTKIREIDQTLLELSKNPIWKQWLGVTEKTTDIKNALENLLVALHGTEENIRAAKEHLKGRIFQFKNEWRQHLNS